MKRGSISSILPVDIFAIFVYAREKKERMRQQGQEKKEKEKGTEEKHKTIEKTGLYAQTGVYMI